VIFLSNKRVFSTKQLKPHISALSDRFRPGLAQVTTPLGQNRRLSSEICDFKLFTLYLNYKRGNFELEASACDPKQ
jgi:hypothetical protein